MPASARVADSLALVFGEDEYSVKRRAREIFDAWCVSAGGMDHEIIDAAVSNSGDALKAMARLRESLQTLPFFGSAKVVWFKNCSFLGEERAASVQAVTDSLNELAAELKTFSWQGVRLLISAGKIDKRKSFYKTLDKVAMVENLDGWSTDDRDWAQQASVCARRAVSEWKKTIDEEALHELVAMAGFDPRTLLNEIEKLTVYIGDRDLIERQDVEAIVTRNKQARAFALADALGDRDLPKAMRCLDEEIWEMRSDTQKSEIGLLYGLISKVRALLFLKEMTEAGWVKTSEDFNRFKAQLERIPKDSLPEDKRYNPLSQNPYILFKALPQSRRYTQEELVQAMQTLLESNQRLISTSLDASIILQRALVQIIGHAAVKLKASPR